MSYRVLGYLGQATPPPEEAEETASYDPLAPLTTSRGFVKVPTYDVRQYVQTTLIVLAVGFGAGVGVGAVFGNILSENKLLKGVGTVFRNPRRRRRRRRRRTSRAPRRNAGKRRTSARRRKRGRPTVKPVREDLLTVKLPEGYYDVEVRQGKVHVGRLRSRHVLDVKKMNVSMMSPTVGTVYDTGTKFRAVPRDYDAPAREFGTLAGAVKHLIRHRSAA